MDPALVRVSGPAMGSLFEIYVGHEDAEEAERLARAALRRVEWLEQKLSHFLPDSDIWRINAAAAREPVPIAGPTMDLLRRLRRLYEETEAAFDCTAGKLVRALGFFRRGEQRSTSGSSLDASEVAAIVAAIGWRNVELNTDGNTVRFLTPAVELHLGAAGKGYIVQCAADFLREAGVRCALLHSGQSSIAAIGAPPDSEGWRIRVPDPLRPNVVRATVTLTDASLSTSGDAEQFAIVDGVRRGHVFDPRTGMPVRRRGAVSLIAPDATDGDALSTAFFVQGEVWAEGFCRTRPELMGLFLILGGPEQDPDEAEASFVLVGESAPDRIVRADAR